MKLKIIRWTALLIGSVLALFFVYLGYITASPLTGMVGDLPFPSGESLAIRFEWIRELISIIIAFLIPMAVILSWFRNTIGAYLLTVLTIVHIIVWVPNVVWMQIAILPVGPLLLFYVYYNKCCGKKGEPS